MTAQTAMIQAAASIAAMVPAQPKSIMGNRDAQLVFSVYKEAAKAAYRSAAHECLTAAFDAVDGGIDLAAADDAINSNVTLRDLQDMCTSGYAWGGRVVTL